MNIRISMKTPNNSTPFSLKGKITIKMFKLFFGNCQLPYQHKMLFERQFNVFLTLVDVRLGRQTTLCFTIPRRCIQHFLNVLDAKWISKQRCVLLLALHFFILPISKHTTLF